MSIANNDMMYELLVKYLLGETTAEEKAMVQAWLAADPENNREYQRFKKVWEESQKLAAGSSADTDAAWLRMKDKLHAVPQPANVVAHKASFYWLRVAAVFLVLAGGFLWWYSSKETPVQIVAVQTNNQTQTDTLPDGSIVTLNKNSQIQYPSKFNAGSRSIALKGEAFFNVAPNKQSPFIITVNDVQVKVLGTSFNIRSSNGKTEVIVETGLVEVTKQGMNVLLKPKEKITVQPQDSSLQKEPVEDQLYNYYRTKEFVCDNTPLWKLVQVLNEAYGSNIIISRQQLRSLPLSATFYNEPLDNILAVISETFSIKVIKEEDKIILQ